MNVANGAELNCEEVVLDVILNVQGVHIITYIIPISGPTHNDQYGLIGTWNGSDLYQLSEGSIIIGSNLFVN